ncbi:MAG: hypothetical protein GC134_07245 [Proteobacteria bacterium]|nr:hypothetical protein [Pseudomonadota bacterium]
MMTRTSSKRMWLVIIGALLIGAFFAFKKAQDFQTQVAQKEGQRQRLRQELTKGNQFNADIGELDNFTINEQTATVLEILRHLELEDSTMKYQTRAKTNRKVGSTTVYTRRFSLEGTMSYQDALNQVDWLHNTNKVVLNKITLEPGEGYGNIVNLYVEGTLYGLDKG